MDYRKSDLSSEINTTQQSTHKKLVTVAMCAQTWNDNSTYLKNAWLQMLQSYFQGTIMQKYLRSFLIA